MFMVRWVALTGACYVRLQLTRGRQPSRSSCGNAGFFKISIHDNSRLCKSGRSADGCLPSSRTEIAFDKNVQTSGLLFPKDVGERLARFRQIDLDQPRRITTMRWNFRTAQ